MTQCFVYNNCNMIIFIQSSNVKEGFFCILQMLRIYTGLRKWNKKDRFHIFLREKNPIGIKQPCVMIANNEVLFEQCRISLKRDRYAIDIEGEDEIKRNRLFFDFMLIMFDNLNQLYEKEKSHLIDTILKYHSRKESAKENSPKPSPSRKESAKENTSKPSPSRKESVEENTSKHYPSRKERAKENISKTYPKKGCFVDETNRTSQANNDSYKTNSNAKKGACNEARSSEEEHVEIHDSTRKVILSIQTKNQIETVVMRRRINYLSVIGKVTLKI